MRSLRPATLVLLVATGLLAAGCKRHQPPPANEPEIDQPTNLTPPPTEPAPVIEPEKPAENKTVAVPADTHKVSADEQMREDAEATGMTSRLPPPTDDASTQPASSQGGDNAQN